MKNRIKEDNHGFTLVEIVVTIMVLAIITVPLLSYFTDSVRHSARTKQQQNAVVLAQNTLEELKVSDQDLSDPYKVLATASPAPTIDPSASPDPSATPSASPKATLIPWKELAAQPLPTPVGSFYPSYYLYRNVSENDRSYLVQIKVTPKHRLDNTNPADGSTRTEIYEGITLPEVNSSTDVILQEDSTPFNEAVRQFHTKHTRHGGTTDRDVIAQGVRRSIRLTFQEDSAEASNIKVIIYYNYHYVGSASGLSGSDAYYQVPVKITSLPAKDIRNVFIFFEPDADEDHLQFGPEDSNDPNLEHSADFATLESKGLKEGQVKLYLIAQNSAPSGQGDGTVTERSATYKFIPGAMTNNEVYKIFANKAPADSDKTVYTNLLKTEITATGSDMQYLFSEKRTDSGGTEYTLIKKEETDRIAEVEVSVYRDMGAGEATLADEKKRLTTVNGAVVLDK